MYCMEVDVSPSAVVWESTKACDFACRHCRALAIPQRLPNELRTEEVLSLVDDIALMGVKLFVVSGGDALKRDDLFEVLSYSSKKLRTAVSPSGSRLTYDVAKKFREAGVSAVSVSVDGPEEVHDYFRGVPGAFQLARKAVEAVREAGVPLQVNSTISRYNVRYLRELKETVLSMHPQTWDVFMLVPVGRATPGMAISPKEAEEVMGTVLRWRMKEGINVRMTCAPYLVRLANEQGVRPIPPDLRYGRRSVEGARGCMAGNGYAFVGYDGTVYPCGFLPVPAGNVRDRKFSEIYRESPLFAVLREPSNLRGKCGVCEYRTVCGGCRARAYAATGDYLEEDPLCLYVPARMRS
ncbi:radical SAM protein [Sulfodiicoccus acidiphilus]|uniref:Radical SAM protein n=1 Tax=Sulfodiicoccus acidiphilus TaxID=1670455 RepID=A0A348B245_9CREN|nr:radical SAM protein [Sulfodiicoccus acidiphilus]BBD72247.1 radical SAM protein [Sulfodiicoccus acidiphilus]GGT90808.1 radical SAM protein [Sulfodiicoccus acidiphilus]